MSADTHLLHPTTGSNRASALMAAANTEANAYEWSNGAYQVPDEPLIVLRPTGRWAALDFREIWEHRELLYFLTWRDITVRYKQTVLGATWAIIQPLFTMLIFSLFFGRLGGMPSDGIPYPIFAFAGLLPWTYFSNALTASGNSLIGSANLITKVYFPRMIIPAAAVAAGLVDFAIAFVVLIVLVGYYRIAWTWNIVMLPFVILLTTLLALGTGMWISAMNVRYRDVRHALPFLIQLWMFATPIIYPSSIVPERWRWLLALNPLTGIIEGFRSSLLGNRIDTTSLLISTVLTLIILVHAAYAFRRVEKTFADIV